MIGSLKRALESPEARIALDLFRLYQGMETLIRKRGEAEGLSPSQVQTLLFLSHAHPRYKGIGAIAKRFSIAPATASRIVDNLEKKGLVERSRGEQDRRSVRVELTAAGKRTVRKITTIVSRLEGYAQGLVAAEQEALAKGLEEILRSFHREGYLASFGPCRSCPFFEESAYPRAPKPHLCRLTRERLSERESSLERLGEPAAA
ncbi:MAG: MarR family winged helix-turn-helix transcriptional regulator [Candidatus Bipolaricaulia bacterium]